MYILKSAKEENLDKELFLKRWWVYSREMKTRFTQKPMHEHRQELY